MRSSVIFVGLAVLASTNAAVLQPRDACSNGIKIRGSGSVSCSNGTCRACNIDGQCCTVSRPSNSNCDSSTPYLDFSTCKSQSVSAAASKTTSVASGPSATTSPTSAARPTKAKSSFLDRLRALFGR